MARGKISTKALIIAVLCLLALALLAFILAPKAALTFSSSGTAAARAIKPGSLGNSVKILFLGDMMFDRGVRANVNRSGFAYVFGESTTTLAAHDLVVANLEGPITSSSSKTMKNGVAVPGFEFTFPTGTAKALHDAGIDIVSLANNHTYNFGAAGLAETRNLLANAGVSYFGSPLNASFIATSTCINSICIGIVGWHEFARANNNLILAAIKELRPKVDYLVVFPHWGIEYETTPTAEQRLFAHQWIDQGADAVIGAHPHVVETIEQYRGKPIFYSLGNFIFDQYFSFETTHGIGVSVTLTKNMAKSGADTANNPHSTNSVSYSILPFSSVGSRVSLPDAASTKKTFDGIKKVSPANISDWLDFYTVS